MPSSKGYKRDYQQENLAWAAGLFEGEGCLTTHGKNMTALINSTDKDVIERFHSVIGFGSINGPYQSKVKASYKPYWRWRCGSFEHVQATIGLLWKHLGERRKQRAMDLLRGYHALI
jgi:hypothetical protein